MLGQPSNLCNLCEERPRVGRHFVIQVAEIGGGGRAWIDVTGEACAVCAAELDGMKPMQGVGVAGVLGTCLFTLLALAGFPILLVLAGISIVALIVAIVKIQARKRALIDRVVDSPALEPILERVGSLGTILTWQSIQIHPRDAVDPSAVKLDDLIAKLPKKRRLGKRGRTF